MNFNLNMNSADLISNIYDKKRKKNKFQKYESFSVLIEWMF